MPLRDERAAVDGEGAAGDPGAVVAGEQLEEQMPRGTQKKFRRYMADVARRHQVPFVPVPDLASSFEPRDFAEHSHLNYRGSVKYTEALVPVVIQALEAQRRRD